MPCHRGMHETRRDAALALVVAACGGPVTGPTPVAARLAHPATTFNQLQAISAVTNTPLFESFTVLAPRFTPASATGSVALALALDFAARYSPWQRANHSPLTTPCPSRAPPRQRQCSAQRSCGIQTPVGTSRPPTPAPPRT